MNGVSEYFENVQDLSGTGILVKPLLGQYLDGSQWLIKVEVTGIDEVGNEIVGEVTATININTNWVSSTINIDITGVDVNVKNQKP